MNYPEFSETGNNNLTYFIDNATAFASMKRDVDAVRTSQDFVLFSNWWCDLSTPHRGKGSPPWTSIIDDLVKRFVQYEKEVTNISDPLGGKYTRGPLVCGLFWENISQAQISDALVNTLRRLTGSEGPFVLSSTIQAQMVGDLTGGDMMARSVNKKSVDTIKSLSEKLNSPCDAALVKHPHIAGSHHQKILLVFSNERLVAYLGGLDINRDRLFSKPEDSSVTVGAPLFDFHIRLEGPAAWDVLRTFEDRWIYTMKNKTVTDAIKRINGYRRSSSSVDVNTGTVKIVHTYSKGYPYEAKVLSAAQTISRCIAGAKKYIYIEDQYLVGPGELQFHLQNALSRGVQLIVVMASNKVVGDMPFLDIKRTQFWKSLLLSFPTRINLFVRTGTNNINAYVHAKLLLIDDEILLAGSVNSSRRSWSCDSEIAACIKTDASKDQNIIKEIRMDRWSQSLGDKAGRISDPAKAIEQWKTVPADSKLARYSEFSDKYLIKGKEVSPKAAEEIWDKFIDPEGL